MIVKFTMATQHTCLLPCTQCETVSYDLIKVHQVPKRLPLFHSRLFYVACHSSEVEFESSQRQGVSERFQFLPLEMREIKFDEDDSAYEGLRYLGDRFWRCTRNTKEWTW